MAWPTRDELKQVLDITSADWDDQLDRVLAAAIGAVKLDVGDWDDTSDEADEALAAAALVKAELMSNTTTETDVLQRRYQSLLRGHRRRFAIA